MSELKNISCAWDQTVNFISFFITSLVFPWVMVGDGVTLKWLWQRFICTFLMLWKVHRECCNSRNCNLGWADDCVPEITERLTDSSNSRYCVRHYGDWCSSRVYGLEVIVTIRYVSMIFRARVYSAIRMRSLTFSRLNNLIGVWIFRISARGLSSLQIDP